MKKITLAVSLFLLLANVQAQRKKPSIYVLPQFGLLNGDKLVSQQITLSAGWETNNISFGIGAALDYYKMRTVPLFLEFRAVMGKEKRAFAFLNAGPNFIWPLELQHSSHRYFDSVGSRWSTQPDIFKTGFYGDAGFGYSIRIAKKNRLLLSLGYSVKTIHQSYKESINTLMAPYTIENHDRKLDYRLNRIALRIGFKI